MNMFYNFDIRCTLIFKREEAGPALRTPAPNIRTADLRLDTSSSRQSLTRWSCSRGGDCAVMM